MVTWRFVALLSVAHFAQQLNITCRIRATAANWNNVIKLETFLAAALNTLPAISLPHLPLDILGDRLSCDRYPPSLDIAFCDVSVR